MVVTLEKFVEDPYEVLEEMMADEQVSVIRTGLGNFYLLSEADFMNGQEALELTAMMAAKPADFENEEDED